MPIQRELENDKKLESNIEYRIKSIDSVRFIARSLSNIDSILAEGLHNSIC